MHTTAPPAAAQPQNEIQMNVETVLLCVNTKLQYQHHWISQETIMKGAIFHQVFFIITLGKIADAFLNNSF